MLDSPVSLDLDKVVSDLQKISADLSEMVASLDYVNMIYTCGHINYCVAVLLEASATFAMDPDFQNSVQNG